MEDSEVSYRKPNFDCLKMKLSAFLTSDTDLCQMLAVYFNLPATPTCSLANIENYVQARKLVRLMEMKGIISSNDVTVLVNVLNHFADHKLIARILEEYQNDCNASNLESESENSIDVRLAELEKLREKFLCKMCFDNDVEILFLPCKHLLACKNCASRVDNCPMCRTVVDDRLSVLFYP